MTIDHDTKRFIEENIDLIETEDWVAIYAKTRTFGLLPDEINELTCVLEDCGFNPIEDLSYVPFAYHFMDGRIEEFAPQHIITEVKDLAFENCDNLVRIVIPEGCKRIGANAFEDCPNVRELRLPASLTYIAEDAFGKTLENEDILIHAPYPSYANEWLNKHIYS